MQQVLFYYMGTEDRVELFAHTEADVEKSYDMASDWFRNGPPPLERWKALFHPVTLDDIKNNPILYRSLEASLQGFGHAVKMPDSIADMVRPLLDKA